MPKINYDKLSIYKFYCLNQSTDEFYISSTSSFTKKKAIHKKNLTEKPKDRLSVLINSNGGWNNWRMECIEELENTSQKEVVERENYWIHLLSSQKNNNSQSFTFVKDLLEKMTPEEIRQIKKYFVNDDSDNENENKTKIEMIPLGSEKLHEVLSVDEQVRIIKQFYTSIKYIIENIYTKYPQFRNCKITDLSRTVGFMYNNSAKKFYALDKNKMLNHLIFQRIHDIRTFLENENVTKKLKSNDIEKINTVLDELEKIDEDEEKNNIRNIEMKKEIEYILYNNRN